MSAYHRVTFKPCAWTGAAEPDPKFPRGREVGGRGGHAETCKVKLPYPADEAGEYLVECSVCGASATVGAAGRADDPVALKVTCNSVRK
jgi:hypothetical protein